MITWKEGTSVYLRLELDSVHRSERPHAPMHWPNLCTAQRSNHAYREFTSTKTTYPCAGLCLECGIDVEACKEAHSVGRWKHDGA